jgi:hypothetical protein
VDWTTLIAVISPTRPHLVQPLLMVASGIYICVAILWLWIQGTADSGDPNSSSARKYRLINRTVLLGLFVAAGVFGGLFLLSWQQS